MRNREDTRREEEGRGRSCGCIDQKGKYIERKRDNRPIKLFFMENTNQLHTGVCRNIAFIYICARINPILMNIATKTTTTKNEPVNERHNNEKEEKKNSLT